MSWFLKAKHRQIFVISFAGMFFGLMLLGIVAFLAQLYMIYFMGMLTKQLELKRQPSFQEALLECVLYFFFFVGIWIL